MKSLTLTQVKQAGRFAILFEGDGCGTLFVPDAGFFGFGVWNDELYAITDLADVPKEDDMGCKVHRWMHLPNCDCEFCEAGS